MNIKELEALVLEQRAVIKEQGDVINAHAGELQALKQRMEVEEGSLGGAIIVLDNHSEWVASAAAKLDELSEKLEGVTSKVEGRNKSAAVKRNMTDTDARRVLDGDLGAIGHKEAAEQIGLTYAQVYSCRMLHTFKHVHKVLDGEKWKNPWVK